MEKIKTEFEELEKNYLRLVKNNENLISKLEETESKLEIISSEDIPEFKSEETDKDSIVSYLNDSSKSVSYTHLDVYKRQLFTLRKKQS